MGKEKDLLKYKVLLVSMEEIDLYDLAEKVSQMVGNDALPKFVASCVKGSIKTVVGVVPKE